MFGTRLLFPPHFDDVAAGGGGAPARPAVPPVSAERRQQSLVDRLIARHGDANAALAYLATVNITQEDTIERLSRENKDYAERLPEGSVVISAAEAKNLAKLKALGTVDEIVSGMTEFKTLKAEKAEAEAKGAAKNLAKIAGADEDAFAEHYTGKKLKGEVRNVETVEHGKKVTKGMLYVQAGANEPYVAWSDYLAKLPAHEQRALTPSSQPAPVGGPPASSGVAYPVTPAAAPVGGGDPVADYMNRRNTQRAAASRNPLRPQAPQHPTPAPAGAAS